jgi:4-amino-4-deoxy-L-arabinose transferase-like glycosyltransferase
MGALVARRTDLALAVLVALVFGAWLGRTELLNPDEARHAEIAREMLVGGSYLTPTLGGEPYYDKPAAFYWLLAASFSVLGTTEVAARVPSLLASLACLIATALFARRTYSARAARMVVVALATMPAFVAIGRYCIIDMPFTAALVGAASLLGVWWVELPRRRRDAPRAAYALIGVGVLLKGPAALAIFGLLIALLAAAAPRSSDRGAHLLLRHLRPLSGVSLVILVAAPWYLAAWVRDPDYIATFLLDHNLARYLALRPGLGHAEGWWYYPLLVPVMLAPWTAYVLAGLYSVLRRRERSDADLYCLLWASAVLLFFLPADAKLATYVLPALPPLTCIAAAWVDRLLEQRGPVALRAASCARVVAILVGGIVTTAAAAACVYLIVELPQWRGRLWTALPALLALPLALAYTRGAVRPQRALGATAAASCALLLAAYGMAGDIVGEFKGSRALATVFESLPEDAVVRSFKAPPYGAMFYSGRIVAHIDDGVAARALLLGNPPAVLIMRRRHLARLGDGLEQAGVIELWSCRTGVVALTRSVKR